MIDIDILKKTGYVVIDDFIDKNHQNQIEMILSDTKMQWYFYPTTSTIDNKYNSLNNFYEAPQFVHIFYDTLAKENSIHLNKILTVLRGLYEKTNIDEVKLIRVKSNLQMRRSNNTEKNFTKPHIDISDLEHMVLLYYVNDNDGKTFLFNKDLSIKNTIDPKKGRALLFNGNILHASSHPINYETRLVLNFDLEIK